MTAFVLAGGGTRGAVQVGMLTELVERGIRADRVYGASVGAVNGAAYCGDPTTEGMKRLEQTWLTLRADDVFPVGRVHGPWMYFQQRPSIHPNSGLRAVIESGVLFDRIEDAVVPLEIIATSMRDGREHWFTEGPLVEAVLASAAIPGIFPPVEVGDEVLVDGGVVNNVPISRALAAGATQIYVLLCEPPHYHPETSKRPLEAVLTAFFVGMHSRFVRDLGLLPPDVRVLVFSGEKRASTDYRNFGEAAEMMLTGRDEVTRVLELAGKDRHSGLVGWSDDD
ncbi:MAG TPA: patatin-like phospholipase family protein [Acidimicrobiales bacterium]|nr:patatin-like phospholipase family protein [Acidimicrobiales bacterium]